MSELAGNKRIKIVLLQIEEAHSDGWKIGLDHHPKNHESMEHRVECAKDFVRNEKPPYPVYVDIFPDNVAEKELQLWPDVYYLFNNNYDILQKSEYHHGGIRDAKIIEDSTDLLMRI